MPTQRPSRYRVEVLTSPGPRLESRQLAIETYYRCGNFKRQSAIEIPSATGQSANRNRPSHVDMTARKANNLKRSPLNRFEP